jgi:hypothetical protein
LPADQLIGHEHSPKPVLPRDECLMSRGQRDPPRAMNHLHVEEFRRHGGLAMRCKPHTIRIDEAPHPFEILLEYFAVEHSHRQTQVFVKQVPAKLRKVLRSHVMVDPPQPLVLRGD